MKKWENAELVDLSLENTKDDSCPEATAFDNLEKSGVAPASPYQYNCNKKKPDGTKAYQAGFLGICVHYQCGKCTYVAPGGQS